MKALIALILSRLPEPIRIPMAMGFSAVALGMLCLTALQIPTVESAGLARVVDYCEIIVAAAMTIAVVTAIGWATFLLLRRPPGSWDNGAT